MLNSAKREPDKKACEATDEEHGTNPVSQLQLFRYRQLCCGVHANKAGGNDESNTTKRIVDVEAPVRSI